MRIRVVLAAAVLLLAAPCAAYAGERPPATLALTGAGGQTATLAVGRAGLDVEYPFFPPRLRGGDGAVGGVAIQDARGALVGGVLLQNAPGFGEAIALGLVDFERTHLRPGRYRLTLLGRGRQAVQLKVSRGASSRLAAAGPARPITRALSGTAGPVATWTDSLGSVGSRDVVLVGSGSGGDGQQGDVTSDCLYLEGQPCAVPPVQLGLSPGAGSGSFWTTEIYGPGSLPSGRYVYSGTQAAAGPASQTGHASVVIALRP